MYNKFKRLVHIEQLLLIVVILTLLISGCSTLSGQSTSTAPGTSEVIFRDVTAAEAQELIASKTSLQLVDVREEWEFKAGHIPNSVLIPLGSLEGSLELIDPDKPVLLICRTGNRSGQAAQLLKSKGYSEIYNLLGGVTKWPEPLKVSE